jgi:hypothetical protein
MAGFDRESRCCSITRTALCEIGTIDGIHDQSSEKHASGERPARVGEGRARRPANRRVKKIRFPLIPAHAEIQFFFAK